MTALSDGAPADLVTIHTRTLGSVGRKRTIIQRELRTMARQGRIVSKGEDVWQLRAETPSASAS